ncbi:FadR/GntR family transcriptional regulator [Alkalicoccus chagannorensis]|uniref:FadR/GntR family transcriptional regulator n=1 Tax=Alkalicoccus chagannorensis TaxID=427072 RepID=UPI0004047442|nr:FCD domain-containing protein [Alkalicoccus chagannorensis]
MEHTSKKVYVRILQHIEFLMINGGLEAGSRLPSERELAETLHCGRSSVREALRALELLDLIETRKGEGTFLRKAGSHRLAEILTGFFLKDERARSDLGETRTLIEVEAVRLARGRMKEAQLNDLGRLVAEVQQSRENSCFVEQDMQFHRMLVELSGNRLLLNIWRPLVEYSRTALEESLSRPGRTAAAWEEHETILSLLQLNDVDHAADKLRDHLDNSTF